MAWIWDKIRGIGGNREAEADEREEFGGEDPGEAEEKYLAEQGHSQATGIGSGDAADVVKADLDEFKPPRDY
jgi:hypothetical protein